MTLKELKNGMRDYFKKYKSQMTSEERKEFQSAILEVSMTKDLKDEPKEKSDYAIIVGAGYVIYAIRLIGKTEDEARDMYEQAVKEYKGMSVTIYKSFSLYE